MFKPKNTNTLNYNSIYLSLFKEIIYNLLEKQVTPEEIVVFTKELHNKWKLDMAIMVGIKKYTNLEERYSILIEIEKGK